MGFGEPVRIDPATAVMPRTAANTATFHAPVGAVAAPTAPAAPTTHRAATPAGGSPTLPPVEVWVPDAKAGADQLAQSGSTPLSGDGAVRDAYANGLRVVAYAQREFGRASFDGKGSALRLRVHAPDPTTGDARVNNAFWFDDERRIWIGDGDGEMFRPLGGSADVIAHEFFHGVINSEVKLRYVGQQGALQESFADVFATGVDGNWQIAEDVYTPGVAGDCLRDLSKLTYTDWRTFPDGEDEVHLMSEVPSHAAFLVGSKLGMEGMRRVWYTALTDYLKDDSGFAGARDATIAAATALYGAGSAQSQAVIDAWTAVGVTADTPGDIEAPFRDRA